MLSQLNACFVHLEAQWIQLIETLTTLAFFASMKRCMNKLSINTYVYEAALEFLFIC